MIPVETILLVDDEKTFLLSLSDGLKMAGKGFNVLQAGNGEEALRCLRSFQVDMLVTDLKMPLMDGFDLLTHIAKHYPAMPTIVMTAFSSPKVVDKLNTMGFPYCIEKPVDLQDLLRRVQSPGMLRACRSGTVYE